MPLALEFDDSTRTATIRASGRVTFDEGDELLHALREDPRCCGQWQILCDTTFMEAAPSAAELRVLALQMKPLRDRGMGACAVVAGNSFAYGIARMFSVFAEFVGIHVGAFRDEESGRAWLEQERARILAAIS